MVFLKAPAWCSGTEKTSFRIGETHHFAGVAQSDQPLVFSIYIIPYLQRILTHFPATSRQIIVQLGLWFEVPKTTTGKQADIVPSGGFSPLAAYIGYRHRPQDSYPTTHSVEIASTVVVIET